jgi:sensor histidine kinase YesM
MSESLRPDGLRLDSTKPDDLAYERAWRRVRAIRGFYKHFFMYLVVITGLMIINVMTVPKTIWFIYPAMGWGAGLLSHGALVWGAEFWLGREWEEKKIQQLLAREKIRTLSTEKQLVEARLRLLQAQIEPHFLFNTLANVVSLIQPAPTKAQLMLETFIAYLRGSLSASRAMQGTLGQELELLEHYLELLKIRMGQRLSFRIDVPEAIRSEPLAPMLLQPIVENSVRHGLEPKVEGGQVNLKAERVDGQIQIRIEDDGLGFKPSNNSGVGLDNLRQRLQVLYDGQATLIIEDGQPGTRVTVTFPAQAPMTASNNLSP